MRIVNLRFFKVFGSIVTALIVCTVAQAAEICPKIDCDCATLPEGAWQNSCVSHEKNIKARCAKNMNQPTDFCSLHGPAAFPLPLALKLSNIEVVPQETIKSLYSQSGSLYLSLHSDLDSVKAKVSNLNFKAALELLAVMDQNIDNLFDSQRQVTTSWLVYEEEGKAVSAWRTFADDSLDVAGKLFGYGSELWKKYQTGDDPSTKKAYRIISFKVLRMAGKAYEAAGYSYSGGDKNKKAAKAWGTSARVSQRILEAKRESNGSESHVNFYQYQAAARLHRASFYWAVERKSKDALKALTKANDFAPIEGFVNIIEEQVLAEDTFKKDEARRNEEALDALVR